MTPSDIIRGYPLEVVVEAAKRTGMGYGIYQVGNAFEAVNLRYVQAEHGTIGMPYDHYEGIGSVFGGEYTAWEEPRYQSNPPRSRAA